MKCNKNRNPIKLELQSANINNRLDSVLKEFIKLKRLHENNINLHNRNIVQGLEFLQCFTVIKVKTIDSQNDISDGKNK